MISPSQPFPIRRSLLATLLLTCALAALAAPAFAHEFWLAPSSYRPASGDTVKLSVFVGTGFRGELKPYAAPRVVTWRVHAAADQDLRTGSVNGDDVFGRFVASDGGGAMVAYESNFVSIELPADEFDAYLALEGLDGPLAARKRLGGLVGNGRERYARCPKTWIAGIDLARAKAPAGLTIELIPLADPATSTRLPVELRYRGAPLPGALVRAWRQSLASGWAPQNGAARDSVGPVASARTDSLGHATLALAGDGEWLVSAVHMERSGDPRAADWESFWASLTFARRSAAPHKAKR